MKEQGIIKKPKNHTVVHVFVMILSIIMGVILIRGAVSAARSYYIHTHADFVKEYATIVRYEHIPGRYAFDDSYSTFYEYEADGVVYYGLWQRLIQDEEEAKAQVGKKAPIYVDHALKYHSKSLDFPTSGMWIAGTFSAVCCLAFLNSFVREIIFIVRWKKYKKYCRETGQEIDKDKKDQP